MADGQGRQRHRASGALRAGVASLWLVLPACLVAQQFPAGMDYAAQLESSLQSNSNPGRTSNLHGAPQSSVANVHSLGLAARIPLLSDQTRLDIGGQAGKARFGGQHQYDYRPYFLNTRLHARLGPLFKAQAGHESRRRRYESDHVWPRSDTVTTRRSDIELSMHPSEGLALPIVRWHSLRTRYGESENGHLFNRDDHGWEILGRYQSPTGSSLAVGFSQVDANFPQRYLLSRTDLDKAYKEREAYTELFWNYSAKTALYARAGWQYRQYSRFSRRNTQLAQVQGQIIWRYSPKTEWRLSAWHSPYSNDEDPNVWYSTLRGAGLEMRWRASPKVSLDLQGIFEIQKDTALGGGTVSSPRTRLRSRLVWEASRNLDVVLEAYSQRKRGDQPWNQYTQNVVRLGIVLHMEKGASQVRRLLSPQDCRWSYLEANLCVADNGPVQ